MRSVNTINAIFLRKFLLFILFATPWTAYGRHSATHFDEETFSTPELIATSILDGIFNDECAGYCFTGACAHLVTGFSISSGFYIYTVISPKLRHATPEFLVSAYNAPGYEPYLEWRETFGAAVRTVNEGVLGNVLPPDALQGGRPDPIQVDRHQGISYKEVDIIGHPLAILPDLLKIDGFDDPEPSFGFSDPPPFERPTSVNLPSTNGSPAEVNQAEEDSPFFELDVRSMLDVGMMAASGSVRSAINLAMDTIQLIDTLNEIRNYAETINQMASFVQTALTLTEATVRGSFWGNFINPRFRAPRLMCPNEIRPLQPYYLSFADFFYWRAGYPITDGPLSGDDHSAQILNPFSGDTLPSTASAINPLADVWGMKYPRDGFLNHDHDAKVASVTAWRAMDVLLESVPSGVRVGVEVPQPLGDHRRWQMIFPEVKECVVEPYYPDESPLDDFITSHNPNTLAGEMEGGYAWNVYGVYECCSNTRGAKIAEFDFPQPICFSLP